MSIASRIEAIEQHLTDDYSVLTLAGADLTNVDKNILNLKPTWKERLLYFMNNGTDVVWNNWDKVTGEGTSISLNNTLEGKMKINLKGNTSQEGTPTPETPQDIHVVSGDNIITIQNSDNSESQSYHITLPEGTELCKIGDYQDSIVKDNGKWYLKKEIGKVVLNGSEGTWGMYNVTQGNLFRNMDILRNVVLGKLCYANYYRGIEVTASNFSTIRQNGDIYINPSNPYIDIVDNTQSSASNFVSWLGTHNLILYYAMTTPTYAEITDSTLLSQLNALAKSYASQTNISQENNDLASILNATALKEMS